MYWKHEARCPILGCEFDTIAKNHIETLKKHLTNMHNTGIKLKDKNQDMTKILYLCDICGHRSHSNQKMKMHRMNVHKINEEWLNCDLCEYRTKFNAHLKAHKSKKHSIGEVWYFCNVCNYKSKYNYHIKRHKASKHDIGVIYHFCDECDYKSKHRHHLKRHKERVHQIKKS